MKFFTYVALVATVAAHEQGVLGSYEKPHPHPHKPHPHPHPTPSHHGEIDRDVKELDHDIKELDHDLKEMMHHRHHNGGGHGHHGHHRHHRGGHGGHNGGQEHHKRGGGEHRDHWKKWQAKKHAMAEKFAENKFAMKPVDEMNYQMKFDQLKIDIIQLEKIVDGVLRGATNAEGFNDIAKCVTDLENVLGDAETAVKDFKAGGATNVVAGLKAMGDLINQAQAGMKDCSSTTADWDRLKAMAAVISSPKSFVYHVGKDLLING
jgi:hypothetical protein